MPTQYWHHRCMWHCGYHRLPQTALDTSGLLLVYFWSTSGLGRTYLTLSPIPPIYMCGEKSVMRRNFKFIHLPDVPEFNRKLYIWRMKSKVAFTMQCEKNIEIVPPKPAGRLWDDWEEYFREKNYNSWPDDVLVVTDTGPPLSRATRPEQKRVWQLLAFLLQVVKIKTDELL